MIRVADRQRPCPGRHHHWADYPTRTDVLLAEGLSALAVPMPNDLVFSLEGHALRTVSRRLIQANSGERGMGDATA